MTTRTFHKTDEQLPAYENLIQGFADDEGLDFFHVLGLLSGDARTEYYRFTYAKSKGEKQPIAMVFMTTQWDLHHGKVAACSAIYVDPLYRDMETLRWVSGMMRRYARVHGLSKFQYGQHQGPNRQLIITKEV